MTSWGGPKCRSEDGASSKAMRGAGVAQKETQRNLQYWGDSSAVDCVEFGETRPNPALNPRGVYFFSLCLFCMYEW